jgi:hypothetical protein
LNVSAVAAAVVAGCEIVTDALGLTAVTIAPAGMPVPLTPWPTNTLLVSVMAIVVENAVVPVRETPLSEIVMMGGPV